jgi:hypothetical protein
MNTNMVLLAYAVYAIASVSPPLTSSSTQSGMHSAFRRLEST